MKIRVLIAEDDQSIRKWYAYSLGSMEDIELLPMAETAIRPWPPPYSTIPTC